MVVKKGKLIPAANNNNGKKHESNNNNNNNDNRRQSAPARTGDVYAQVKMLKQSVQEVNALIEPKRSDLILQRTKELVETVNTTPQFTRSVNTASVKRSSNFKSILNKFNVMSTSTTPTVVEQNHPQQPNNQKRSLPNIKT